MCDCLHRLLSGYCIRAGAFYTALITGLFKESAVGKLHFLRCWSLALPVYGGLMAMPGLALAQSSSVAGSQDEVACVASGRQGDALQACLRDARAVHQERRQGRSNGADDDAQLRRNAVKRCERLPVDRQQECRDMMRGHQAGGSLSVQGDVQGGGILREFSIPVAH